MWAAADVSCRCARPSRDFRPGALRSSTLTALTGVLFVVRVSTKVDDTDDYGSGEVESGAPASGSCA